MKKQTKKNTHKMKKNNHKRKHANEFMMWNLE